LEEARDDQDRLEISRALFTQYWIWHSTNTAPWHREDPEAARMVYDVDVEALGEYLRYLGIAHRQVGASPPFQHVLDAHETRFPDDRWAEILLRERLLDFLFSNPKKASALAALPDSMRSDDPEVLELILSAQPDLDPPTRIQLTDRLLSAGPDWESATRARVLKGLTWELLCQPETAAASYQEALAGIPEDESPTWSHAIILEAYALASRTRPEVLERGLTLAAEYFAEIESTPIEVDLRHARASLFKRAGLEEDEIVDRRWIYESVGTAAAAVDLASSLVAAGEVDEAESILHSLNFAALPGGTAWDFAFVAYGILASAPDSGRLDWVREVISAVDPEYPLWREMHQRIQLALVQREADETSWKEVLRNSFILQPTVFGFGVDLKPVFAKLFEKRKRLEMRDPGAQ